MDPLALLSFGSSVLDTTSSWVLNVVNIVNGLLAFIPH